MSSPIPNRRSTQNVTGRRSIHSRGRETSPVAASPKTPQRSHPSSDDETDSLDQSTLDISNKGSSPKVTVERTRSPQRQYEKVERQYEKVEITVKRREKNFTARTNSPTCGAPCSSDFHTPSKEAAETSINRSRAKVVERMSRQRSRSSSLRGDFHVRSEESSTEKPSNIFSMTLLVLIVLAAVFGVLLSRRSNEIDKETPRYCDDFERLKKTFPHQNEYIWKALKTGIEGVINNRSPKPSIFLFLHHDDNSTHNIITDIVNTAAACFDPKLKAVTLAVNEFNSNDAQDAQGVLIERYREALKSGGVVLIADLNKITPHAAKALHFICDNENPIIDNVVIFLTLKALSNEGRPIEVAEDTLNTIWNADIDANTLSAIVTRITDQVLPLYPE